MSKVKQNRQKHIQHMQQSVSKKTCPAPRRRHERTR